MKQPIPKNHGIFIKLPDGNIKFRINNPIEYQQYLNRHFKDQQKGYAVLKKEKARKRTTGIGKGTADEESNQNGYLWGLVLPPLCDYFGYTPYEMLDALRPLFFFKVNDKDPNIKKLESTTEYTTIEWEEKMEQIRTWALVNHGIRIPLPNEAVSPHEDLHEEINEKPSKDPINPLIELFEVVNPSYMRLYANTTQRKAMERLIKQHGTDKLEKVIKFLPTSNAAKFAPTITTPLQLETDLGKLLAWGQKQKAIKPKVANLGK